MTVDEIIAEVTRICKKYGVERVDLFGSFATGTATDTSDVDFVVYGCKDISTLKEEVDGIMTLRKIDLFDFDHIRNKLLIEEIEEYGRQIY